MRQALEELSRCLLEFGGRIGVGGVGTGTDMTSEKRELFTVVGGDIWNSLCFQELARQTYTD